MLIVDIYTISYKEKNVNIFHIKYENITGMIKNPSTAIDNKQTSTKKLSEENLVLISSII
ncbi:hypothetical protein [Klebsiella phage phiKp_21]|nr:hypothetical protein [Klebsiella phage phiKp_21]